MKKLTLLSLLLSLTSQNVISQEFTYTQNNNAGNNIALGFPVPLPVESLTPIDGFRTYNSLHLRHQQLAAESEFITAEPVGTTFNGREILAYQLSDNNNLTTSGDIEGSALINSGIHAREWQTPEAVTGYMETLFASQHDQHVSQYILENLNLVIIPVLNIDGFLQTQRYPETVVNSEAQPRDGRMRRKNMRNVDELLSTTGDNLGGIDLNRNNNPYWATNPNRSSSDVDSIVHHGAGPASEPETNALQQAAVFANEDRLRFYTDTHSFTQVYFAPRTGNARRDAITSRVASTMRAVNDFKYGYGPSSAGAGIGATDEYFANTYQIPAYTLELEPENSAADYGGFGVSHDGFILPNAEVARMREETANAAIAGLYMVAAMPYLQAVTFSQGEDVVLAQQWQKQGEERALQTVVAGELLPGETYMLTLTFNKPMRALESGQVADFHTLSDAGDISLAWLIDQGAGAQEIEIDVASGQWLTQGFNRYQTDSYQVELTIADDFDWQSTQLLSLVVDTKDMVGQQLDAHPKTIVDWQNGHWTHYENTEGEVDTDLGGIDKSMRLIDDGRELFDAPAPEPTPEPTPTPDVPTSSKSSGGSMFWLLLLGVVYMRRLA